MVFSFGHEMNGNWYAWGTQDTNVIWLRDAKVTYPVPNIALEPLYPDDAYVNWIGLTGYYNITAGGR